jgi:hypothetical protein
MPDKFPVITSADWSRSIAMAQTEPNEVRNKIQMKLKTYAEATEHAPFDCNGACKRDGDCRGEVRTVEVLKNNESWGRFNYCETAIKTDERNGYEVRFWPKSKPVPVKS